MRLVIVTGMSGAGKSTALKMLEGVKKRVSEMDIDISFSDEAAEKIAEVGFDEVYGARPLRRAVRANIEDKLSEMLLESKIKAGKKYICTVKDGEFSFSEDNGS